MLPTFSTLGVLPPRLCRGPLAPLGSSKPLSVLSGLASTLLTTFSFTSWADLLVIPCDRCPGSRSAATSSWSPPQAPPHLLTFDSASEAQLRCPCPRRPSPSPVCSGPAFISSAPPQLSSVPGSEQVLSECVQRGDLSSTKSNFESLLYSEPRSLGLPFWLGRQPVNKGLSEISL